MRIQIIILLIVSLWFGVVHAEESTDGHQFILASVKNGALAGKSISNYCSVNDSTYLKSGESLLVIGKRICEQKYLPSKTFLEVAWRDSLLFIDQEAISTTEENSEKINLLSEEEWQPYRDIGPNLAISIHTRKLEEKISILKRNEQHGLTVIDWTLVDESEYTKGTGVRINVYNPGKKTIKYIWFNLQGYNAVDDRVGTVATVKAIGPIEYDSGGEYKFEYTWMTDIVESAKFTQIKIQFMDGSVKTITKPSTVILSNAESELINE